MGHKQNLPVPVHGKPLTAGDFRAAGVSALLRHLGMLPLHDPDLIFGNPELMARAQSLGVDFTKLSVAQAVFRNLIKTELNQKRFLLLKAISTLSRTSAPVPVLSVLHYRNAGSVLSRALALQWVAGVPNSSASAA